MFSFSPIRGLGVDDTLGLFSVGVHHIWDAGYFGGFFGKGHDVLAANGRDAEIATTSHDLLQSDSQLCKDWFC
jgi:hypothetical protein